MGAFELKRCAANPLIRPQDVKPSSDRLKVVGTLNAGVIEHGDEVIMMLRVAETAAHQEEGCAYSLYYDVQGAEPMLTIKPFPKTTPDVDFSDPRFFFVDGRIHLTNISHMRVARSRDGVHFTVADKPSILPADPLETLGADDARITRLGDTYWINYTGESQKGITTALASTKDFVSFKRHGTIFCPENRDVTIFPEKINGKYCALNRPVAGYFRVADMWLACSDDLLYWGNHKWVMGPSNAGWDKIKVGGGAVPIRTGKGWLVIYHGVDPTDRYCLGAALLDLEDPSKVIGRTFDPILQPQMPYETTGFYKNVCFTCGAVTRGDQLWVYYGGADTVMARADCSIKELLSHIKT